MSDASLPPPPPPPPPSDASIEAQDVAAAPQHGAEKPGRLFLSVPLTGGRGPLGAYKAELLTLSELRDFAEGLAKYKRAFTDFRGTDTIGARIGQCGKTVGLHLRILATHGFVSELPRGKNYRSTPRVLTDNFWTAWKSYPETLPVLQSLLSATPKVSFAQLLISGYSPADLEKVATFLQTEKYAHAHRQKALTYNNECLALLAGTILYAVKTNSNIEYELEQLDDVIAKAKEKTKSGLYISRLRGCGNDTLETFLFKQDECAVAKLKSDAAALRNAVALAIERSGATLPISCATCGKPSDNSRNEKGFWKTRNYRNQPVCKLHEDKDYFVVKQEVRERIRSGNVQALIVDFKVHVVQVVAEEIIVGLQKCVWTQWNPEKRQDEDIPLADSGIEDTVELNSRAAEVLALAKQPGVQDVAGSRR